MLKIDKRLTINVADGSVTERMADTLNGGRVKITESLRNWCIAGYQLHELGGGVIHAWLGMEANGELDGMESGEKADVLINLLHLAKGGTPATRETSPPDIESVVDNDPATEKKSLDTLFDGEY